MVLVEFFDDIVRIKVVIGAQGLPHVLGPLNILLPPTKIGIVIHKTEYQIHSMLLGLGDHKVQTLQ